MTRMFVAAVMLVLGALFVLDVTQPVDAAEAKRGFIEPSLDSPAFPAVLHWPAPQAPFEATLITPFETVGAANYEPF